MRQQRPGFCKFLFLVGHFFVVISNYCPKLSWECKGVLLCFCSMFCVTNKGKYGKVILLKSTANTQSEYLPTPRRLVLNILHNPPNSHLFVYAHDFQITVAIISFHVPQPALHRLCQFTIKMFESNAVNVLFKIALSLDWAPGK